jgi:hypothetical protein
MKDSLIRLLAISFATVLVTFLAISILNLMGRQQVFRPFDHPLLNSTKDWRMEILNPQDLANLDSSAGMTINLTPSESTIPIPYFYLEVKNDTWLFGELNFESLIKKLKPDSLAIFVSSRINLPALTTLLFEMGYNEKVIVFSNEQIIQIELRKKAPRWLYVANPSQKMRVKLMDSFWLAPMATFNFDIYPFEPEKDLELNPSLLDELHKRFKILIKKESEGVWRASLKK